MGDKRTDSGQFYPGGKVIPRQPVTPGGGADPNAVHYTEDANKSDSQKEQARQNIGAMSADTPIPPETQFDDEPTEGSQKAARSGGIWSWVKSLLPSWLTASTEEPRGKTDLDVYDRKWVFSGPAVDAGNQYRLEINYYEPSGRYDVDLYRVGFDEIVDHRDSDTPDIKHVDMADTYLGLGVVGDLLDVKTPSKLAHTSATSGLAKLGEGGELTAATPSSTGGANADYRDTKDNTCHNTEFGEWDYTDDYPWRLTYSGNNVWMLEHDTGAGYYNIADYSGGEYETTITLNGGEPGLPEEIHRQLLTSDGKTFITRDLVFGSDGKPTDQFAADLLSKPVAKKKVGEIIAERVSELDPDEASVYDLIKALKGE